MTVSIRIVAVSRHLPFYLSLNFVKGIHSEFTTKTPMLGGCALFPVLFFGVSKDILIGKFRLVWLVFRATWQCVWLLALALFPLLIFYFLYSFFKVSFRNSFLYILFKLLVFSLCVFFSNFVRYTSSIIKNYSII